MGETTELETRVRPFYCGTQGADWQIANCENCVKGGHYTDPKTQMDWVWPCDIQQAIDHAYMDDGHVSAPIGARMGFTYERFLWRCNELVPVVPIAEYFESLKPPPTRLCPLYRRAWRALCFSWTMWIKPWDRTDHEEYSGLRSPVLAWQVAWGLHDDDRERIDRKSASR